MNRASAWLFLGFSSLAACVAPTGDAASSESAITAESYDPVTSYAERVRIVDKLQADHPLPAGFLDPRDGIAMQTRWQEQSRQGQGGLPDVVHANAAAGRVLYGWWPNVNYSLTAFQMIALKERRGEYRDVNLRTYRDGVVDRCVDVVRLTPSAEVMDKIAAFYDLVDETTARDKARPFTEAEKGERESELQSAMWEFHEAALGFAIPRNDDYAGRAPLPAGCESFGTVLPSEEAKFAVGWGQSLVPLLAAVNLSTAKEVVKIDEYILPYTVVLPQDTSLFQGRSAMAPVQRAGAAFVLKIADIEQKHDGPLANLLGAAGKSEAFRDGSFRVQSALIDLLEGLRKGFEVVGADKEEGERCLVDQQCEGGLYCRNDGFLRQACLPAGNIGDRCWTSEQCTNGASCRWKMLGLRPSRVCD